MRELKRLRLHAGDLPNRRLMLENLANRFPDHYDFAEIEEAIDAVIESPQVQAAVKKLLEQAYEQGLEDGATVDEALPG